MVSQFALALPAPTKEVFACLTIGVILSSVIYGITFLQTYIYFRRYPEDHLVLKVLVGVLFILDSASSALDGSILYEYFVIKSPGLEESILFPPPLMAEVGVKAVFIIVGLAPDIVTTRYVSTYPDVWSLHHANVRISGAISSCVNTACDILLASGLCLYLKDERSERARTNNLLDRIIRYAIERCAITAVCQTCIFINEVASPDHFFFLPFLLVQGKLYCNTLLAILNVRLSLREAAANHWGEQLEPGLGTCVFAVMPQNTSAGVSNTVEHFTPRAELVAPVEVDITTAKRD
ncbi:hypothetical protein C8Q74DRAFT_1370420 [Fomes fomentarius]|nr:hypothetical protein C8Q74DRAFT_1370420 [Fomes fomentarius]